MNKYAQYIISVVFSLLLIFPLVARFTNLFPEKAGNENRNIAEKPTLDLKHLDRYPAQFDAYFNDNFSLRGVGINLYNRFNYFFLKKSPAPNKAILGNKDWVFQGTYMDQYRGAKKFSKSELILLANEFKRRYAFLKQHNCRLLFVVIPSKENVYPEYIPYGFYKYSKTSMTDQFLECLKKKTAVETIDLRPVMIKAKSELPLYHKSDHHWNDIGAYYAYREIINYLKKDMTVGEPHEFSEYEISSAECAGGGLSKVMGMGDQIKDIRFTLTPKYIKKAIQLPEKYKSPERFPYPWAYERRFEVKNDTLPRLMMVNDSFGEYLYPLLAEHFSYSLFLFDNWEFNLYPTRVIDEKPSIFIICFYESLLSNLLTYMDREENKIQN